MGHLSLDIDSIEKHFYLCFFLLEILKYPK